MIFLAELAFKSDRLLEASERGVRVRLRLLGAFRMVSVTWFQKKRKEQ